MKRSGMVLLVILWLAVEVLAGFEIPRHVFRMDQLEQAKKLARRKKAPITFIYTNKDTH